MRNGRHIVVIGGGAAGFFAAINLSMRQPETRVTILEKTGKLLSKVSVSGGGRCNVTHHCFDTNELLKNYPRGAKELRQVFAQFAVQDTIDWFRQQGISLKTEADGRMFPRTDSSQTIIDCFLSLANQLNIQTLLHCGVEAIEKEGNGFRLRTNAGELRADAVICASGGHNKAEAYRYLTELGHHVHPPIPSLFTLNLPGETIQKELQGLSVPDAEVRIEGSKLSYRGPVLITHWGLSGPAVLKLSAFAAKDLHGADYRACISVNWIASLNNYEVFQELTELQSPRSKALPRNQPAFELPRRLWEYLCARAELDATRPWAETGKKQLRTLTDHINNSRFRMEGKTTFKEEFVTCGGVSLKEVDFKTMQSKVVPGLYFCGEVLDIDGITGGFNFQSAWSTAWICAANC